MEANKDIIHLKKQMALIEKDAGLLKKESGLKDKLFVSEKVEKLKALKEKVAAQSPTNTTSMLSGNMKWFLIGGGVLLLGFLIGRSIKGKRSHRY